MTPVDKDFTGKTNEPGSEPLKNIDTFMGINIFRKIKNPEIKQLPNKPVNFPIEAFPKGIQDIITETHRVLNYPIDFIGTSVIYASSVGIGNTCKIEVCFTWVESAVFYFALVGPSGTMKSPPLSFALSPLHELDANYYSKNKNDRNQYYQQNTGNSKKKDTSGDDIMARPVLKKHLVTDITKESLSEVHENNPRGIGVYVDELAAWFKNFNRYNNGSDQEFWLSSWSLKPIVVDRIGSGCRFIQHPFISVIGTIQSKLLYLIAKDDRGANGFIDRVLFAMPATLKKEKWNLEQLNPIIRNQWKGVIERLIEFGEKHNENQPGEPKVFRFSSQALVILTEWQAKNAEMSNKTDDDSVKGIYSKLEIYVIRLCLVLHRLDYACSSFSADEVQPSTVNGALLLTEYFRNTALRVNDIINNRDPLDGLPIKNQELYNALPVLFTTKEAIQIGNEHGFAERTIKRMLNNEELFRWIRQGQYEKRL